MADDELTAAREKVLGWGPDLRQPTRMERFRQDVAELERLASEWAVWNAAAEPVTIGYDPAYPEGAEAIVCAREGCGKGSLAWRHRRTYTAFNHAFEEPAADAPIERLRQLIQHTAQAHGFASASASIYVDPRDDEPAGIMLRLREGGE